MTPEDRFQDPKLEQALSEMRQEPIDDTVVEAAAARVWARLAEAAGQHAGEHIGGCEAFQALLTDYRAGKLSEARSMLVKDHLHECVACRRVFEGKVVVMPAAKPRASAPRYAVRWAAAAVVVIAAGVAIWQTVEYTGGYTGRATVRSLDGALYLVTAAGIQPLAAGQEFPDGAEIRSAKDTSAVLQLRDGSLVELRERSSLSTSGAVSDLVIHLGRGSVIVEAAKRRRGHLYVDTADCRVAVTGTIFGVSAGAKGSRVSVVQGEVHVSEGATDRLLQPGQQTVTGEDLEPETVREDIGWSRNRNRYFALLEQLAKLRAGIQNVHLPDLRYSSRLLDRLPASTVFYASIPNLASYLGQVQSVFNRQMAASPELSARWGAQGTRAVSILTEVQRASEYLGDEIAVVGTEGSDSPVFLAEARRPGFEDFLKQAGLPLAVEARNGRVIFGPERAAVDRLAPALDAASGGFAGTPFYARIQQAYAEGAGLLLCADLSRMGHPDSLTGLRYVIAEDKEVHQQMEARATLGFESQHTGPLAWLADPAPMGSLDYVSSDATLLGAFVVRDPGAMLDQIAGLVHSTPAELGAQTPDTQRDLAASLGGEFALAMDGPAFPVPSWKLVVEVYDPARFESTVERLVAQANQQITGAGEPAIRTAQENVNGRTYYMVGGGRPNPLTEAHYTFADGYLIAGSTRALVAHALEVKDARTSILRSARFTAMAPRDHYANFSAVIYQNLGQTLAPLAGLLGSMAQNGQQQNAIAGLGNMKPLLVAAYGASDRLTVASSGDLLGMSLTNMMTGSLAGMAGNALPLGQLMGTRPRNPAYKRK